MRNKIIIIGAGISGITTALVLQLLGCDTVIYAEHIVGRGANRDPRFASKYPAASVIPHSVHSDRLAALFTESMQIFDALYEVDFQGMKMHRHYEVYEFPVEVPEYTRHLQNCVLLDEEEPSSVPRQKNTDEIFGWAFDCYIAEWPVYIKKLYMLYEQEGGKIYQTKIKRDDIKKISSEVIVNCSGVWSNQLFEDDAQPRIVRGHIIQVPNKPNVKNASGHICSYNYTPKPSIYATPDGKPCDVYFYPVGDKWLLGGSRQAGTLNREGKWVGKAAEDTLSVNGTDVPSQILTVNNEILNCTYQTNLISSHNLRSFIGYRFKGMDSNGLRLDTSSKFNKTIVHNYGHGGAGVTLSWGCALQAARLLNIDADASDIIKML